MIRTLTFASLLALAACGGTAKPAATTATDPAEQHAHMGGGGGDHHQGLSAEMARFHDVLRPHWHMPQGPDRMPKTCEVSAQLQTEAAAIAKATPPRTANADTWTAGTRALVAAVGDLVTVCKANDTAGFEAAFSKVHDAFHQLMKASMEERPEPGQGSASGSAGSAAEGGHDHTGHKH